MYRFLFHGPIVNCGPPQASTHPEFNEARLDGPGDEQHAKPPPATAPYVPFPPASATLTSTLRRCGGRWAAGGGGAGGVDKDTLLSARYSPVPDLWEHQPLCADIDEVAAGSFKKGKKSPEIIGRGYVVKSLEEALWAFYHSADFRDGCLLAVNLGDDADTAAAIYGQIAGAYYGVDGVPAEWPERVAKGEYITQLADGLWRHGS